MTRFEECEKNGVNGVAQKKSDVATANKGQKITRFVIYSVNARIAIEVYSHAGVTPEVSQILPVCRCLKYFLPAGRVHNVLAKVCDLHTQTNTCTANPHFSRPSSTSSGAKSRCLDHDLHRCEPAHC